MYKLTDKELEDLIASINIYDTYQTILWAIRDSRTQNSVMDVVLNVVPDEKQVDETQDDQILILYNWANNTTKDNLDAVIRKINAGTIRMNLREIYKKKAA